MSKTITQKRVVRGRKAKWTTLDIDILGSTKQDAGKQQPAYYSFDGVRSDFQDNSGQTWMLESEAYWQVKKSLEKRTSEYPKTTRYVDASSLPLKKIQAWDMSQRPGAVRAYFYRDEPWNFDVLYHDPRQPKHPESGQHAYSGACYHPEENGDN
ncbi:hypothetical protein KVR01_008908 [Diaporthe batatas]|uniref:uncharacterized protein n=1 Tax=Diaporthe batatas TaxID=748121 RepID=UPI001D03E7E4|nr:uncharacterized protein KVR01_008908 [Diaporthe batatas]KAG8160644.1 hypothetical protein KVR01_008908 [Diaporthe batatas]